MNLPPLLLVVEASCVDPQAPGCATAPRTVHLQLASSVWGWGDVEGNVVQGFRCVRGCNALFATLRSR